MGLVLEIPKDGKVIFADIGVLTFYKKTKIDLASNRRLKFMYNNQIMEPEAASTPARRLYMNIQFAYVDYPKNLLQDYPGLTNDFVAVTDVDKEALEAINVAIKEDRFFAALKIARDIIAREDKTISADQDRVAPTRVNTPDTPLILSSRNLG